MPGRHHSNKTIEESESDASHETAPSLGGKCDDRHDRKVSGQIDPDHLEQYLSRPCCCKAWETADQEDHNCKQELHR